MHHSSGLSPSAVTSFTSASTIRLSRTRTFRAIQHAWQKSWTLASLLPTWQINQFQTTPGSAPISVMICMGLAQRLSDPCDFSQVQSLIATGDTFLNNTVSTIMNSQAFNGNSVIFITWDESDFPFSDTSGCCDANPGGGHVVMLTISHSSHKPRTSSVAYNHYSMLSTIEGGWSLGCLANHL